MTFVCILKQVYDFTFTVAHYAHPDFVMLLGWATVPHQPGQRRRKKPFENRSYYDNMGQTKSNKGRYLNDVRTEGGGGVTPYVTNTTDRLRECVTRGEGVQNPENFGNVIFKYRPKPVIVI